MQLWITSDSHFGHRSMIDVFKKADGSPARPFASVDEMDEVMLTNWNARVKPGDHVWHLGDFAMKAVYLLKYGPMLNGRKRLIRGNHDIFKTKQYLAAGFEEIRGVSVLNKLVFTHIPIHPLSMARFRANVHGHTHDQPDYDHRYLNMSVERMDYTPQPIEVVEDMVAMKALFAMGGGLM